MSEALKLSACAYFWVKSFYRTFGPHRGCLANMNPGFHPGLRSGTRFGVQEQWVNLIADAPGCHSPLIIGLPFRNEFHSLINSICVRD